MRMVRPLILWMIGGLIYTLLEIVTRGRSHWTMFIVGGLCFYLIGLINEVIPWEMAFWKQCIIGSFVVTGIEFVSGCIVNLWLGTIPICHSIFWGRYVCRFRCCGYLFQVWL